MSDGTKTEYGRQLLSEAVLWKSRAEKSRDKFDECKRALATFFKNNRDIESLTLDSYDASGSVVTAKLSERVSSLNYNVDALRNALSKDQFNEVVHKTYVITDIDKMVSLLKNAGVSPSEFKQLIHVEEQPDKAAIQQLFSLGDITVDQLKGTYSAVISQSVNIKIKEKG